jgi:hypothetical protein
MPVLKRETWRKASRRSPARPRGGFKHHGRYHRAIERNGHGGALTGRQVAQQRALCASRLDTNWQAQHSKKVRGSLWQKQQDRTKRGIVAPL